MKTVDICGDPGNTLYLWVTLDIVGCLLQPQCVACSVAGVIS